MLMKKVNLLVRVVESRNSHRSSGFSDGGKILEGKVLLPYAHLSYEVTITQELLSEVRYLTVEIQIVSVEVFCSYMRVSD